MGFLQRVWNEMPGTALRIVGAVRRLRADKRGNILMIFGLALPLLFGVLGLAVEGSNWYQTKRALQNAADEAAVAAATNASTNYDSEARSVTARYGFTNAVANVTVTAKNDDTCPGTGGTCYSVEIQKKLPLVFSQIVGFAGNSVIGSSKAVTVTSKAYAIRDTATRTYCILALANSGNGVAFQTNGGPKADLAGCSIMSNTSMTCNGHNLNAEYGDAFGTNNGCGINQESGVPKVTDPYSSKASNIPEDTCATHPQIAYGPGNKVDTSALPSANLISGSKTYATQQFCGDVQLTGDVTLNGDDNVLVIQNGDLDTNGYTIRTATGAAATIIFSGDNGCGCTHIPTGGGNLDIAAPTEGTWQGVAMYQDPKLTSGVDMYEAGNTPSWNITGITYLPHSSIVFKGIVGKATSGGSCFVLVVDDILIDGTGKILQSAAGECEAAGVPMPANDLPVRGRLVG